MVVLQNKDFVVEINELGAELKGISGRNNDIDYLWRGNLGEKYWQRSATFLFPFVGRLQDGKYTYAGKEYSIGCHGFVKDMVYEILEQSETTVLFAIKSNDDTRAQYPFDFDLNVRYTLDDNHLTHEVTVKNTDSKEMIYKVGFHPGINVPLEKGTEFEDWKVVFNPSAPIERRLITERGLDGSENSLFKEAEDGTMRLNHEIFKDDAIVLKNTGGKASVVSEKSGHSVAVNYDSTWVGIWQTYTDDTPFVAIEPWYQLPGKDLQLTKLEEIEDAFRLLPGDSKSYSISFDLF